MSLRARSVKKVSFEFERRRAGGWAGIALAAAGAIAAAAVLYEYFDTVQRVSAWETKLAEVKRMSQRTRGALSAKPGDPAELRQEIRLANNVLHEIALPWDSLFAELERCRDKSIALLSIQPDLQNRLVRIGGEARNLRAVVDYAQRLDASAVLHDVYVVGHEVKKQDPQRPVTFALVAGWR